MKFNLREENGQINTSRTAQVVSLLLLVVFGLYFSVFFVKATIVMLTGGDSISMNDVGAIAGAAVSLFSAIAIPMWSYRKKNGNGAGH